MFGKVTQWFTITGNKQNNQPTYGSINNNDEYPRLIPVNPEDQSDVEKTNQEQQNYHDTDRGFQNMITSFSDITAMIDTNQAMLETWIENSTNSQNNKPNKIDPTEMLKKHRIYDDYIQRNLTAMDKKNKDECKKIQDELINYHQ